MTQFSKPKLTVIALIALLLGSALTSPIASAKELTGRMGIGYNAQFANTSGINGVPAISLKYGLAPRAMIEIVAGFYSGPDGSGVAALKYMRTLYAESYTNLYFLLGGGLVSSNHKSGSEFLSGLGAEFFIPGIESVGISFETGVSLENLTSNSYVIKTFGISFINAGMHFYF